jgi:hypothetical protein
VGYAPINSITLSTPTYGAPNTSSSIPAWSSLTDATDGVSSPVLSVSGGSLYNIYVSATSLASATSTINPFYQISSSFPATQLAGTTVPTTSTVPGFFVCYSCAHILTIGLSLTGSLSDGTTLTRSVHTQIYIDNP